jgi:hypothetical protein
LRPTHCAPLLANALLPQIHLVPLARCSKPRTRINKRREQTQSATIHSASGAKSDIEAATIRAISWRLIPFLVLTYFFSYLDRVNLGFAVLTMNAELKFTPLIFSWGARRSFSSAISCSRCRATWRWKKFGASAGSRASW